MKIWRSCQSPPVPSPSKALGLGRNYDQGRDVEQKIIYPLLTMPGLLAIPADAVKTKSYLAPTKLDKAAGRSSGYFPDYSVWELGLPLLIVEAKDPSVDVQAGFREACLYARHLNTRYPTGVNPCRFVIATNGNTLLAGYWDQEAPVLTLDVSDLRIGTTATDQLVGFCHASVIRAHADTYFRKVQIQRGVRPFIRNEYQISAFQLPMISKFSVSSVRSCGTYASSLAKNCRQASLYFSNVS